MTDHSTGTDRADRGAAAGGGIAVAVRPDEGTRRQLQGLLDQVAPLRSAGVFTLTEHEQIRSILLGALRRLDEATAHADEVLDADEIDASPDDPDVLDALDLDVILAALDIPGDVNDPDVLDAEELPEEDVAVDAVDLGDDADDSDALEPEVVEVYPDGPRPKGDADGVSLVDEGSADFDEQTFYVQNSAEDTRDHNDESTDYRPGGTRNV